MEVERGLPLERVKDFLARQGLDWDGHIESTVNLVEDGRLCATGSRQRNVLKCIAVAPERQGDGLTATVISELVKDALEEGHIHLFLFTKPRNGEIFQALGFYPVEETEDILLLKNRRNGVEQFVRGLARPPAKGVTAAIVANCNPFTNGHKYLVERAAAECGLVYLFILSEERSAFPARMRLELAGAGVAHLPNVAVCPTGDYLVSSATFPDYFIKDKLRAARGGCELDLRIFARRFAAPLGITRRYVGTEPDDAVTAGYNAQMHEILPPLGVEVAEMPRYEHGGVVVSAGAVRALLLQGRLEEARALVPESTYARLEEMKHGR